MFSQNVGGILGRELFLQQQLLLYLHEQEQAHEEQKTIVRGVSWLRDPLLSKQKAARGGASSGVGSWTCPRCRSHLCMRVNPGDAHDPVYCCAVCGYTFHKASTRSVSDATG
ncbi:hypothetical protein ACFLSG_00590 [Candidatus Bipolaricaulota bacterium]